MSRLDPNHVRVDRIFPPSLSGGPGGYNFSETGNGQGQGIIGGGIVQVVWGRFDSATSNYIGGGLNGSLVGPSLGWQVEIVPRHPRNKILIYCQWSGEVSGTHDVMASLDRRNVNTGSYTTIGTQSGDGNRLTGITPPKMSYAQAASNNASTPESFTLWFVDEPNTTNTLQYMPRVYARTARTMYIGRCQSDTNSRGYERMINTMMAWEISS